MDGRYGICIKLTRGKIFIAFSTNVWLKDERDTIPIDFVSYDEPPEFLQNPEILHYRYHYRVYTPTGILYLTYEPEHDIHDIYLYDLEDDTSATTMVSAEIRVTTNLPPRPLPPVHFQRN